GDLSLLAEDRQKQILYVRFGAGATSMHSLVVPNLTTLRNEFIKAPTQHREAKLYMRSARSHETVTRVVQGELDVGVVRESAVSLVKGLSSEWLGDVGYCMILPRKLAKKERIYSLRDLARSPTKVVT